MTKIIFNKKILLLDDNNDENETVVWIEKTIPKKIYFNCGCCKNCLCNDTSSCKNCGCACNCIEIDDYFEIEDDDINK